MAAADAEESHSSLPKENTCGSDALCLVVPPLQGKTWHQWLIGGHPSKFWKYQFSRELIRSLVMVHEASESATKGWLPNGSG
jgi:hypothetical protein